MTREVLSQTVSAFLDSKDGGRDGAFEGDWDTAPGGGIPGPFVVQCKFSERADHRLSFSEVQPEVQKAAHLVAAGRCHTYILMTNAGVSGATEEKLHEAFSEAGVRRFVCLGYSWICQVIRDNKRLRMLVPRVYGLGDLSQILDERAYEQATALLASLQDDLSKVVLTRTYYRAAEMLEQHGFVLLLGEPAAGKSTIAAMLAMAAIDQWGCSTLKLDEPARVIDHWNPHEPSQFFWIDDAFGVTQYEALLAYGWNRVFPQVSAALRRGARVVMTSRDYIYNQARRDLKPGAFPLLKERQIVIDVHDLSLEEKRQILYNHMKLGNQPKEFRNRIKPHLESVAQSSYFLPEIARRLANPVFTNSLILSDYYIVDFVEHPRQFLQDVLLGLDKDSEAALALIYMAGGHRASPVELTGEETEALSRLGSTLAGTLTALNSLRDSLVRYAIEDGQPVWTFKHPTIADAFAEMVLEDPELMGIYLTGTPIERLVRQVTCGDVQIEHAVIVPEELFDSVLQRLVALESTWANRRLVDYFLAYRCSAAFLKLFAAAQPSVYSRVSKPGLYLHAVSEVPLALRLHEFGLLPEASRKKLAVQLIDYAVEGSDPYVLENKDLRSILNKEENKLLRARLSEELLPRLDEIREQWQSDCGSEEEPEECMGRFLSALRAYQKELRGTPEIRTRLDETLSNVQDWIDEITKESNERPPRSKIAEREDALPEPVGVRSIFDDVDS